MLRPRIIPSLLLSEGALVKTTKFSNPKYVGDPLNAVRIFNEKEVDELVIFDIMATRKQLKPDFALLKNIAAECRMPLCYGGGITHCEQVLRLVGMGVEKVAISSAVTDGFNLVAESAAKVGSQSIVVVADVKKHLNDYLLCRNGGTSQTNIKLENFVRQAQDAGAGEIVINNIDRDGTMLGYDHDLVKLARNSHSLPMSVLGGAGSLDDMAKLIKEFGIIGAAAGSLFVFKGSLRAVLINYPNRERKSRLYFEPTPQVN